MSFRKSFSRWWDQVSTSGATEFFNLVYFILAMILWLLGITIISHYYSLAGMGWDVFGKLLFISAAAFLTGALGGFLFGIPKTLQDSSQAGASNPGSFLTDRLITNTNLEQISDWLTKIIVGLGLVNLKKLPIYIEQLRLNFASTFPDTDKSISYAAVALVIYTSMTGFICMYVYTRVNISSLFLKNNIDGEQLIKEVVNKVGGTAPGMTEIRQSLIKNLQSKEEGEK